MISFLVVGGILLVLLALAILFWVITEHNPLEYCLESIFELAYNNGKIVGVVISLISIIAGLWMLTKAIIITAFSGQ